MYGSQTDADPSVPIMSHNIIIPARIWKRFLMGTYSWMIASIVYMLLAIATAINYIMQNDSSSRTIIAVSYGMAIMSNYWLSANIRDYYRYQVLRSDRKLNETIKRSLGGPSDCTRGIRIVFAVAGVIAAGIVFIVSMNQTTSDKVTNCSIELNIIAATAVLTKTFQDREDSKFLCSFDAPQRESTS